MKYKKINSKELIVFLIAVSLLIALVVISFDFSNNSEAVVHEEYLKGKVLRIVSEEAEENTGGYSMRKQIIEIEIISGEEKGKIMETENILSDNTAFNINVDVGNKVLLYVDRNDKGEIANVHVAELV
ncbi:MAG: hypothetical protein WCR27_08590, partial [Eubacteriales bacterium]